MKQQYFIFAVFFIVSIVLTSIFFKGLRSQEFLFMGDQFFQFTYHEAMINSFFLRKLTALGSLNGWQFIIQFWDGLYYLIIYSFGVPFILAEKLLFFVVLLLSLFLSYIGFEKFHGLVNKKKNSVAIAVITLWYCFNPYPVELWHGGVYNLGLSLTYALSPLILYYFYVSLFTSSGKKKIVILATLMAIASFTFWLFASLVFVLIVYSLFFLLLSINSLLTFLKNLLFFLLFYIPLISFILFNILFEYLTNSGNNNSTFNATFGNELGGIWYQFLLLFSWGIYQVWTPRSMYPFHDYYFSSIYKKAVLAMYGILVLGILKYYAFWFTDLLLKIKQLTRKRWVKRFHAISTRLSPTRSSLSSKFIFIYIITFLLALFFAKASQPPLGEIFLYFYNHVPFFSVFRSADIRFGFAIVLCIAVLFVLISSELNKYVFSTVLLLILFYQSPFFFNGIAIQGENVKNLFYNRVLYYPRDYQALIRYLNKEQSLSSYIFPLPAVDYGNYTIGKNKEHIGQDILSKMIDKQFIYLSLSGGMYSKTYQELVSIAESKQFDKLVEFPVQYVLLRKDIQCSNCFNLSERAIGDKLVQVYRNSTFALYEVPNYSRVIKSPNTIFVLVNPIKYKLHFSHVTKNQLLQFLTSYNRDWKLYLSKDFVETCSTIKISSGEHSKECAKSLSYFEGDEISYLWKRPIFETSHRLLYHYANSWEINPTFIKKSYAKNYYKENTDGSLDFNLILYYQPQSWYYLFLLLNLFTFIVFAVVLVKMRR